MSTTTRKVLDTWAANWPDTITLGEAAEEIGFDLYGASDIPLVGGRILHVPADDEDLVLHKRLIPVAPGYSRSMLEQNDSDDFFGPIEGGLDAGGHDVPPVIDLDGELRDGNHRMVVAKELGLTHVPVYTNEEQA